MKIFSQKGMSLLEVLVTGGLLAGMAAYGSNLISQQQQAMRGLMAKGEAEAIHESVRKLMGDPESCTAMVNANYPSAPPDLSPPLTLTKVIRRSQNPAGAWINTTIYQTNTAYGGGLVKIKSLMIRDNIPTDVTPGPKLVVEYEFLGKIIGVKEHKRLIDVNINFTASGSYPGYNFSCSGGGGSNTIPVQMVTSGPGGGAGDVQVQCPAGWKRISCFGTRQVSMGDTCDEDECGFIGVAPFGTEGCRLTIDTDTTNPQVWAVCIPQ